MRRPAPPPRPVHNPILLFPILTPHPFLGPLTGTPAQAEAKKPCPTTEAEPSPVEENRAPAQDRAEISDSTVSGCSSSPAEDAQPEEAFEAAKIEAEVDLTVMSKVCAGARSSHLGDRQAALRLEAFDKGLRMDKRVEAWPSFVLRFRDPKDVPDWVYSMDEFRYGHRTHNRECIDELRALVQEGKAVRLPDTKSMYIEFERPELVEAGMLE